MEIPVLTYRSYVTAEGRGDRYQAARDASLFSGYCPFCQSAAHAMRSVREFRQTLQRDTLAVCLKCGWWSFEADNPGDLEVPPFHFAARAVLQKFEVSEREIACDELAKYIVRHPDFMSRMDPRKLEELAASIYKEVLGYSVEFVSYGRPDQGIDILCTRHDAGLKAIQVKRHRRPINVGQIREFIGAMLLEGHGAGVFLTTGMFQAGCHDIVRAADPLGIHIDLVDGKRLLEFIDVLGSRWEAFHCPWWGNVGYGSSTYLAAPMTIERIRAAPFCGDRESFG